MARQRKPVNLIERFIVLYAPGWPGGHEPTPNTQEEAERFQKEHGGEIKSRFVSDWVDLGSALNQ